MSDYQAHCNANYGPEDIPSYETCGTCRGAGYSSHPDSGEVCETCGGSGGVERTTALVSESSDRYMRRARALVEAHIANYGMVPHPDKIKEAIAAEFDLALRAARVTAPNDRYRPPTPSSPETMKVAEDWYTYGFQGGMEAEQKCRARQSGPDISHADVCLLSRVFHQRDFPISLDASVRINEWLKAQIAAAKESGS